MKFKIIASSFFATIICGIISCNNPESTKQTETETQESANEKLETIQPDFRTFPQYLSCKIDGQPYVAYYAENHIANITNALNMATQVVFATSADQVQINDKTKISEFTVTFFSLPKLGTLVSTKDFYVQGHTDFPENNDLKYVSFTIAKQQQLTLSSVTDGLLEGTFSFDVIDEKDPAHVLKITDGVFKLQQEKKTNLKVDGNGDVNVDSMLKSLNVN